MVALHGWVHGRDHVRPSKDADILVDVRVISEGTGVFCQALVEDGYELTERSVGGHGHSFARGEVSFDVLAPDGLGPRAQLLTIDGFRTVRVPGGTQALHRTAALAVRTRAATGTVPLPNLLGAILVKVRAIDVDDEPEAQRHDDDEEREAAPIANSPYPPPLGRGRVFWRESCRLAEELGGDAGWRVGGAGAGGGIDGAACRLIGLPF